MVSLHSLPPGTHGLQMGDNLQSPLIQWPVLALDPVTGSSLQTRVQGTGKDGAIFLQVLWCWVLGARKDLWIQEQLWGPKYSRHHRDHIDGALKMGGRGQEESEAWLDNRAIGRSMCQPQSTEVMAYLDGLLTALDLLYLSLGQGDPLPNGLQLASAQLYPLGDPTKGEM